MANPEHVKILKKGVDHWNQWRKETPDKLPKPRQVKNPMPIPQIEQAPIKSTNTVKEEIDYEEWINRVPLHKPKKWAPFGMNEGQQMEVVG